MAAGWYLVHLIKYPDIDDVRLIGCYLAPCK